MTTTISSNLDIFNIFFFFFFSSTTTIQWVCQRHLLEIELVHISEYCSQCKTLSTEKTLIRLKYDCHLEQKVDIEFWEINMVKHRLIIPSWHFIQVEVKCDLYIRFHKENIHFIYLQNFKTLGFFKFCSNIPYHFMRQYHSCFHFSF